MKRAKTEITQTKDSITDLFPFNNAHAESQYVAMKFWGLDHFIPTVFLDL